MKYRALTNENFYYIDAKRMATVIKNNKDFSKEELLEYIRENDIIEANNTKNQVNKCNTIYKRLSALNPFLVERLSDEAADIGKFINLLSIILNEKIVYDFLNEVIREKYYLLDKSIDNMEFNKFMTEKAEEVEEVGKWTEESRNKIITRIKTYFVETGYLIRKENRAKTFEVAKPLIPIDIVTNIEKNYGYSIVNALLQK